MGAKGGGGEGRKKRPRPVSNALEGQCGLEGRLLLALTAGTERRQVPDSRMTTKMEDGRGPQRSRPSREREGERGERRRETPHLTVVELIFADAFDGDLDGGTEGGIDGELGSARAQGGLEDI